MFTLLLVVDCFVYVVGFGYFVVLISTLGFPICVDWCLCLDCFCGSSYCFGLLLGFLLNLVCFLAWWVWGCSGFVFSFDWLVLGWGACYACCLGCLLLGCSWWTWWVLVCWGFDWWFPGCGLLGIVDYYVLCFSFVGIVLCLLSLVFLGFLFRMVGGVCVYLVLFVMVD